MQRVILLHISLRSDLYAICKHADATILPSARMLAYIQNSTGADGNVRIPINMMKWCLFHNVYQQIAAADLFQSQQTQFTVQTKENYTVSQTNADHLESMRSSD